MESFPGSRLVGNDGNQERMVYKNHAETAQKTNRSTHAHKFDQSKRPTCHPYFPAGTSHSSHVLRNRSIPPLCNRYRNQRPRDSLCGTNTPRIRPQHAAYPSCHLNTQSWANREAFCSSRYLYTAAQEGFLDACQRPGSSSPETSSEQGVTPRGWITLNCTIFLQRNEKLERKTKPRPSSGRDRDCQIVRNGLADHQWQHIEFSLSW